MTEGGAEGHARGRGGDEGNRRGGEGGGSEEERGEWVGRRRRRGRLGREGWREYEGREAKGRGGRLREGKGG